MNKILQCTSQYYCCDVLFVNTLGVFRFSFTFVFFALFIFKQLYVQNPHFHLYIAFV